MGEQAWRDSAACKDLPANEADKLFFIGPGQTSKRAQMFCASCPVRQRCNNFALIYNEVGIWAGTTDDDRSNLDKGIVQMLKENEATTVGLESRNINDFIPQQHHLRSFDFEPTAELELEPSEVQLTVLVQQFALTNDPWASGL